MHGIHDLRGLINHRQRRADRRVSAPLANLLLRRATNTHARLGHVFGQCHQAAANVLIRQRHDCLVKLHAVGLNQCATARRHAEDVGVLACAVVGHKKAREIGVHASIQHLTPSSRQSIRRITQDVQQTNVVKAHAWNERILDEIDSRFRKFLIIFIIIANNT